MTQSMQLLIGLGAWLNAGLWGLILFKHTYGWSKRCH